MAAAELPELGFALQGRAVPRERLSDRGQQRFVFEGLRQELDRARLHGSHGHRHLAVPGDEDDGHVQSIVGHTLLQLEAIEVGKSHVEDQATRGENVAVGEKLPGGGEESRLPAGRFNQEFQGFPDGDRYFGVSDTIVAIDDPGVRSVPKSPPAVARMKCTDVYFELGTGAATPDIR